jgi:hypothetical protein
MKFPRNEIKKTEGKTERKSQILQCRYIDNENVVGCMTLELWKEWVLQIYFWKLSGRQN